MKLGILADINAIGQVTHLVQRMQSVEWADFWTACGLVLRKFEDVGLSSTSSDLEIWQTCQTNQLVLITDNRNHDSPESLQATIRQFNKPNALPVFTIGDLEKYATSAAYAQRVLVALYDYLLRIDDVRGTGRLYLP